MSEFVRSTRCRRWILLMTLIAAMFGVAGQVIADPGTNQVTATKVQPRMISDGVSTPSPEPDSGGLQVAAPPSNDTCAAPAVLQLNRAVQLTMIDAVDDYQTSADPLCYSGIGQTPTTAPGRDVVAAFTAPAVGSYTFSIVQGSPADAASLDSNRVLYVSATCPISGVVPCIKGANRNLSRAVATAASGSHNNQSEQVSCLPMLAGQTYFVFLDQAVLATPGNTTKIEVRNCITETEPNNTTATANPMVCGIEGISDVAPAAHCHLGFRGGSDANGLLNDGAVCTRSIPLSQAQPQSNTRCTISGNPCSWSDTTGIDTCPPGEGHCEQLTDLDCDPHCTGGPNNGLVCSTNAFCNPGSAQNATCAGQCVADSTCITTSTGADTGISCHFVCANGTFAGRFCNSLSDCQGGGGTACSAAVSTCASGQTCGRQFNEGDVDFFSLGVVPSGNKIFAGLDAKAANDMDWRMRVTTTTNTIQFDDDDGVSRNGSLAPEIAGAPGQGTDAFIKISRTAFRASEPYLLYSIVQGTYPAQAQNEDESVSAFGNDGAFAWPIDTLNSNLVDNQVGGNHGYIRGLFNGSHVPGSTASDTDCFRFIVNEGDLMSWYTDMEPARNVNIVAQFGQPIVFDAEPAGISNFGFGANARKNIGVCVGGTNVGASCTTNAQCTGGGACNLITGHPTLNGLAPQVSSSFFQWRASYSGMLEVCYYDASVFLSLGTPGPGNWAGSLDVNCGPMRAAGPGTTTTDVSVVKTILDDPDVVEGQAGQFLTYEITITNSSADIAQEVRLSDTLDPNLSFIELRVMDGFRLAEGFRRPTTSGSLAGGNTHCVFTDGFDFFVGLPSFGTADAPIDCTNASMAPGSTTTYRLTVQVNNCIGAGIDIENTATISTMSTDPDPSNDSSSVSFTTTDDGSCQQLLCDASGCVVDACFQDRTRATGATPARPRRRTATTSTRARKIAAPRPRAASTIAAPSAISARTSSTAPRTRAIRRPAFASSRRYRRAPPAPMV